MSVRIGGILTIVMLLWSSWASAGARLLNDNRLSRLSGKPSLGRGYNIEQNSLQAMCFDKVVKGRATFDFFYEINQVDKNFLSKLTASKGNRLKRAFVASFLRDHLDWFADEEDGPRALHTMLVEISVDTYGNSLDEANSRLSGTARQLLRDGRYVQFFSSCGYFYVRSVRRFSEYIALIQFRSSGDEQRDQDFLGALEKGLLSFNQQGEQGSEQSQRIIQESGSRELRVYVRARGLAKKNDSVDINLVPVSIDQFRETVQRAANMMTDRNAGAIAAVEIAPWMDHPEVNIILNQAVREQADEFRKMFNLELNSQVVTNINEHRTKWMDTYYFASICERSLYERYPSRPMTQGLPAERYYDAQETKFYNLANESDPELLISLEDFRLHFREKAPQFYLDLITGYLHGKGERPGANTCIDELYKRGLETAEFLEIPACVAAIQEYSVVDRFIEEYCLPKPAILVYAEE